MIRSPGLFTTQAGKSDPYQKETRMSQYEIGTLEAKTDRAFSESARYRVINGRYYTQSSLGALTALEGEQTDRARGYLEAWHGETLYV